MHSVLGVIDLKAGTAVHAVAGQRASYQPVCCPATRSGDAMLLAQSYIDAGVGGLYVADLDAIVDGSPNNTLLSELAALDTAIWIDAGRATLDFAQQTNLDQQNNITRVIGTESLAHVDDLAALTDAWRRMGHSTVLSLDFQSGQLLAGSSAIAELTPEQIVAAAIGFGIQTVIVLDLAAVGIGQGTVTASIIERLSRRFPLLEIATGGGIRSPEDTDLLKKAGCNRFLVGTALHAGAKKFRNGGRSC